MTDESLGAIYLGNQQCRFVVWAPRADTVDVHLHTQPDRYVELPRRERGYFDGIIEAVPPGTFYRYRIDGADEWPDPASRWQPDGVHGPSAVVDHAAFEWHDAAWRNVAQHALVFYELHVGTFSSGGTFEDIIPHLPYLRDLGVTALELMPVAQFPGARNWGYDGVYPYAAQSTYGGPDGLRMLVDACHGADLAVFLDCVYNHLGPEGNYTAKYGPYFTDRYHTPWGDAINMDGPDSDEVRHFFIENACAWVRDYHIDGFRLDATDRIIDQSATHFLAALTDAIHRTAEDVGKRVWVIAESDANDVRYISPQVIGGYGLHGQWGDDLHHALHALLTGERGGYYAQFGSLTDVAKAYRQNFVFDGKYSTYRRRTHGNSPRHAQAQQFVVATQNHDQVGNRAVGDRLCHIVDTASARLAAAVIILSPFVPLIFMGEEYAETAPFQYFTSHTDSALAQAVTRGRREEFRHFGWQGDVPDPQDEQTFLRSKLHLELRDAAGHVEMLRLYRDLLRLRRELPALANLDLNAQSVTEIEAAKILAVRRWLDDNEVMLLFSFSSDDQQATIPLPVGNWNRILVTDDATYGGPGVTVPDVLVSQGMISLTLNRHAAVVLARSREQNVP